MDWYVIAFVCLLIVIFTGITCAWRLEINLWNKGYCKTCKNKWVRFDTDSQGGRGYNCMCAGNHLWVSYPRVDK